MPCHYKLISAKLDRATSQQLKILSARTGKPQRSLIAQALSDFLAKNSMDIPDALIEVAENLAS